MHFQTRGKYGVCNGSPLLLRPPRSRNSRNSDRNWLFEYVTRHISYGPISPELLQADAVADGTHARATKDPPLIISWTGAVSLHWLDGTRSKPVAFLCRPYYGYDPRPGGICAFAGQQLTESIAAKIPSQRWHRYTVDPRTPQLSPVKTDGHHPDPMRTWPVYAILRAEQCEGTSTETSDPSI
jgi:hypothetical protein